MSGLYVASNAAALGAQIQLQRNMGELEEIITRLSTGLRINSGKDDPAGLIASELLKSDITATKQAIQNTQRANSVIAIADSALGQISSLLNDIRGLVNMSANTGAMTPDQIQANQLQIDASLDSIDRISKTTNYQGQLLLDGSFDFITRGVDRNMLSNLQINSSNFGLDPAVDITIQVLKDAERAQLIYSYGIIAEESYVEIGGVYGRNVFKFEAGENVDSVAKRINAVSDATGVRAVVGAEATYGQIMLSSAGTHNDINLTSLTAGSAAGNYSIKFTAGNSTETNVVITEPSLGKTGVIDFQLQMEPWSAASAIVYESMLGVYTTDFQVEVVDESAPSSTTTETIRIDSTDGKKIYMLNLIQADILNRNIPPGLKVAVDLDKNGTLNVEYDPSATLEDIANAINSAFPDVIASVAYINTTPGNPIGTVVQTGRVQGTDIRTSHAITIKANNPGDVLNDTDFLFVNNVHDNGEIFSNRPASTTITLDGIATSGNTLTVTALDAGFQFNGIEFIFEENTKATANITAVQSGNIVTVTAKNLSGITAAQINDVLAANGLRYYVSISGSTPIADGKSVILGAPVAGDVIDSTFNTSITVAQKASTTINLSNPLPPPYTTVSGTLTISAKEAGSQYNGIEFRFESGGTLGTISAKQTGNIITVYTGKEDYDHLPPAVGGTADPNYWTVDKINAALVTAGLKYELSNDSTINNIELYIPSTPPIAPHTSLMLGVYNTTDTGNTATHTVLRGTVGLSAAEVPTNLVLAANGEVLKIQNVVEYVNRPQRATSTIFDGANYLTFTSATVGNQYNGIDIKIENDTDNYSNGKIVAAFNAKDGVLHVVGDLAKASYSDLIAAVHEASGGAIKVSVSANPAGDITIATGGNTLKPLADYLEYDDLVDPLLPLKSFSFKLGDINTTANTAGKTGVPSVVGGKIGTDHGSIIYNAIENFTKGQMVVDDINNDYVVGKLVTADRYADSDGKGFIFQPGDYDLGFKTFFFSGAMTGGYAGANTVVTANDLVKFINEHPVLKEMFSAELALGNNGYGLLTLFQEVAYYGNEYDVIEGRALQFLGPADSPNIEFRADGKNQELWIEFINDPVSKADAYLTATNANAAISITATQPGSLYDDVALRFVRLDSTYTAADNYATFEAGATAAVAYCDIHMIGNNTNEEIGNFILTATSKGDTYNNVDIVVMRDSTQTAPAAAKFDPQSKRLTITINDPTVTLQQVMAAIEEDGTFTADYDYSYNANPYSNPGMSNFEQLLGSTVEKSPVLIGNTGNTGGHTGGIVTVYLGGSDAEITAQAAIDAINSSVQTKTLFVASNYPSSDGTGLIDIRKDSLKQIAGDGSCLEILDFKVITSIPKSLCDIDNPPTMIVHLATDAGGRSITTAQDLIDYFATLTPEQTRGISVSLLLPAGIPNVGDPCDDLNNGQGILQPTGYYDECDNWISYPIVFESANTHDEFRNPTGRVVAVFGDAASYDITATVAGTDYEGVSVRYQAISEPDQVPFVSYDKAQKIITIHIIEGYTTAAQVKEMIETSDDTKSLFKITLADGSGGGFVTIYDDAVSLSGGVVTVGTPGGAQMTGAYDEDPNRLILESVLEGSKQYVTVRVVSGNFDVKDINGKIAESAEGKDMKAQMNGVNMVANGRQLSVHTAMLDFNVTMSDGAKAGDSTSFKITGGGATFQMGPDVVTNQQIRLGIPSVNTTRLGGPSGFLYELKTGERADLSTADSCKIADKIIQEAITAITFLRGRLGAIQKSTLEPNMAALEDTIEQMTTAEANITNADFAEESSRLARAQILVQSGAQVLGLANQLPQYAASLLSGR